MQRLRPHAEREARIGRQRHRDRRPLAAGVGVVVNEVAHGAEVRRILGQRGGDGGFERGGAVAGEQLQQPPGEHAQMRSAFRRAQEQGLGDLVPEKWTPRGMVF